ncbi:hypothetical protein C7M84_014368 [Penaeus vannamei]|uniref:Uncharacterized protein n=1 Tax=Penaeus vannamei TaxID=6689 RepID=A0A423STL0_PENVA|nr:hypothetical protein C7M84_014368 [Penaeus vannamei]
MGGSSVPIYFFDQVNCANLPIGPTYPTQFTSSANSFHFTTHSSSPIKRYLASLSDFYTPRTPYSNPPSPPTIHDPLPTLFAFRQFLIILYSFSLLNLPSTSKLNCPSFTYRSVFDFSSLFHLSFTPNTFSPSLFLLYLSTYSTPILKSHPPIFFSIFHFLSFAASNSKLFLIAPASISYTFAFLQFPPCSTLHLPTHLPFSNHLPAPPTTSLILLLAPRFLFYPQPPNTFPFLHSPSCSTLHLPTPFPSSNLLRYTLHLPTHSHSSNLPAPPSTPQHPLPTLLPAPPSNSPHLSLPPLSSPLNPPLSNSFLFLHFPPCTFPLLHFPLCPTLHFPTHFPYFTLLPLHLPPSPSSTLFLTPPSTSLHLLLPPLSSLVDPPLQNLPLPPLSSLFNPPPPCQFPIPILPLLQLPPHSTVPVSLHLFPSSTFLHAPPFTCQHLSLPPLPSPFLHFASYSNLHLPLPPLCFVLKPPPSPSSTLFPIPPSTSLHLPLPPSSISLHLSHFPFSALLHPPSPYTFPSFHSPSSTLHLPLPFPSFHSPPCSTLHLPTPSPPSTLPAPPSTSLHLSLPPLSQLNPPPPSTFPSLHSLSSTPPPPDTFPSLHSPSSTLHLPLPPYTLPFFNSPCSTLHFPSPEL